MITIIIGTNRTNAISKQIAIYYSHLLTQKKAKNNILDLNLLPKDFIFSALYDEGGKNNLFNPFRDQVEVSEKFVFIVPEYNGSFPGVLKAFLDGLNYPDSFKHKKCALVGLSSGVQGGGLALSHLTDIFNYLGMHVLALKPKLAHIEKNISDGKITNKLYIDLLKSQAEQLITF